MQDPASASARSWTDDIASVLTPDRLGRLEELLQGATRIATLTHTRPDGDAVGSSLALYHYLVHRGKKVECIFPGRINPALAFIPEGERFHCADISPEGSKWALLKSDLVIFLDLNAESRTGPFLEEICASVKSPKVLIDHHLGPDEKAFDLVFSCPAASSACELLYRILTALPDIGGVPSALPPQCARDLLVGMTTDTNNFSNSSTPSTFRMAADLLEAGVDRDAIVREINFSYREQRLRALGHVMADLMTFVRCPNGCAVYFVLESDTQEKLDMEYGEAEGFVNYGLTVREVVLSVAVREETGLFRVSVRSKPGASARELCMGWFGGGGHELASGGTIYVGKCNAPGQGACVWIERREDIASYIENSILEYFLVHPYRTPDPQ